MHKGKIKTMITVDVAVIFFVVIIILAHFFAPFKYDWRLNTISDLGAQQYENAWVMRMGFIGFGVLLSTAPFIETSTFSIGEDKWHSLFAQIAGIAFSFGILCHLLLYSNPNQKIINFVFLILVIGFSALVGLSKNGLIPIGLGLIQRGLYVISFIWLLFRY